MAADDLRHRAAARLTRTLEHTWCDSCYPSEWARTAVDALIEELAADPGDLVARMAEAIAVEWRKTAIVCEHTQVIEFTPLAAAALSVRWEHAAHLAARLADAERRAESAEGELSAREDHAARWETEKARADKAEANLVSLQALADRCREKDWAYAAERTAERDEVRGLAAQYAQKAIENGQRAEAAEAQVAALQKALAVRGDDVLAFQKACGTHLPEQAGKIRAERDALKADSAQAHAERDHAIGAWRSFERQRDALSAALEVHSPGEAERIRMTVVSQVMDEARAAALDTPSTPESPCPRCEGSMVEPGTEVEGDWDSAAMRHHPYTGEPCTACNGTGNAPGVSAEGDGK